MNAVIIYNPYAGTREIEQDIEHAAGYLLRHGWRIQLCRTHHPGHATQLASQAVDRGDEVVIAAGGDGTINEVMNALVGRQTTLGILPAGTGNVFAADMKIPLPGFTTPWEPPSLLQAADIILGGNIRHIDVARATFATGESRYFLMWAGIGLDAAVSQSLTEETRHNPGLKGLGMMAWIFPTFKTLGGFKGTHIQLTMDNKTIKKRAIMIGISNSQLYGRFARLSPHAKIDDGLLDVVVMEGYGFNDNFKHLALLALGKHTSAPEVYQYQTAKVNITSKDPLPVQFDAENAGFTPLTIEIVPHALTILLPNNVSSDSFT